MTPAEVAALFRVNPKTVTRWAHPDREGRVKLPSWRTPGGHHRFREAYVFSLLEQCCCSMVDTVATAAAGVPISPHAGGRELVTQSAVDSEDNSDGVNDGAVKQTTQIATDESQ